MTARAVRFRAHGPRGDGCPLSPAATLLAGRAVIGGLLRMLTHNLILLKRSPRFSTEHAPNKKALRGSPDPRPACTQASSGSGRCAASPSILLVSLSDFRRPDTPAIRTAPDC